MVNPDSISEYVLSFAQSLLILWFEQHKEEYFINFILMFISLKD